MLSICLVHVCMLVCKTEHQLIKGSNFANPLASTNGPGNPAHEAHSMPHHENSSQPIAVVCRLTPSQNSSPILSGSKSFGTANGVLRFVELPFVLFASPLAGYVRDTTGSYNLAFLILIGVIAVACICPLFINQGGARERAERRAASAASVSS